MEKIEGKILWYFWDTVETLFILCIDNNLQKIHEYTRILLIHRKMPKSHRSLIAERVKTPKGKACPSNICSLKRYYNQDHLLIPGSKIFLTDLSVKIFKWYSIDRSHLLTKKAIAQFMIWPSWTRGAWILNVEYIHSGNIWICELKFLLFLTTFLTTSFGLRTHLSFS